MLKNIRSNFYSLKKYQEPLEKYVFPIILLLFPLFGVNAGLDITDTTYSLGNYQFLDSVNDMWLFSTYLSNVTGALIMKLPGAGTMLGFGIYCTFITSAIALAAYYFLQRFMPGWMIFIGEFIAEGICFSPRGILYNYLTYLLLSVGTMLIIAGLFSWKRQNLLLFLAGVCLGLNVMVRFPNLVEASLILIVWFYGFITKDKLVEVLKRTGVCILGYVAGFGLIFCSISLRYGFDAYGNGIAELLGMTKGASDYTSGGMLSAILEAYMTSVSHMLIILPCIGAGVIMFFLLPGRYLQVKKLLYMAGILVLVRYYFAKGVFTRNYYYYDCMFQAAMMFIITGIILCVIGSLGILNGSKQEQTLAFAALMLILVTPIGSNNYTFPIMNNMFMIAPIILWLFRRMMQRAGEGEQHFAWQSIITTVIIILLIQGTLFRVNFSFYDGADGTVRDARADIPKVSAMVTTTYNAETLNELKTAIEDNRIKEQKVILFGNVPGLSYIFDLEPAIDTTWPDLDSYGAIFFHGELLGLSTNGEAPAVIIGKEGIGEGTNTQKFDYLMDFIDNHDYNKVFESERFMIFASTNEE
jgi:hypothetical protein